MGRKAPVTELIYGFHPVREVLAAGRRRIHRLLIARPADKGRRQELADRAARAGIATEELEAGRFNSLVAARGHNGVAAVVDPYPWCDLYHVLARSGGQQPFVVILDQVTDPRNLGAMARSAYCAGVQAMILARDRSAGPTAAAIKASAGALEHLHLARVTNLARTIVNLQKEGLWVAGLDAGGRMTIFEADFKQPLALVIGAEDKGIRPLVRKHCDFMVSIPQQGRLGSLNAASAATVAFFEVMRQRHHP